ncbi:MAG TPA: phosphatidylserine decarboxylase [Thermoplasmata archaeon]|nr:phosphatidylserine decarboxylase [Thermoplasmata archaeon]
MFAPGAGRYLGAGAAVLLFLAVLPVIGAVPLSVPFGGLLAVGLAIWLFFAAFFRDPERVPADGVVSAADGRVRAVDREGNVWRISVFMNVTDVHVNRFPFDGRVDAIEGSGEGYRAAFRADANRNVQRSYRLATPLGTVEVVQITGLFARRLVSFVRVGARGRKGDRLGMVVLGSRVDVLVPSDRVSPVVQVGDRVHAGSSTIAREAPP